MTVVVKVYSFGFRERNCYFIEYFNYSYSCCQNHKVIICELQYYKTNGDFNRFIWVRSRFAAELT